MPASFVGIDWGTTHRRAYLLGERGELLEERSDDDGALAARGRYAESLSELLASWPSGLPVVMSGMVGSATGWQEAPYLDAATPLTSLAHHLVPLTQPANGRRCLIVPGYRWRGTPDEVDVMRGEETQLLGALMLGHGDGWYVLPGTHSKWVGVQQGTVQVLRTYMTGELFGLLGQHGTLSGLIGETEHEGAFLAGLQAAPRGALSQTLFGCRARVVAGDMPAAQARSYLSGLLIGAEFGDALQRAQPAPRQVTLIAAEHLVGGYRSAAAQHGCALQVLDPREVYLAAMQALRQEMVA